jgi:integrase
MSAIVALHKTSEVERRLPVLVKTRSGVEFDPRVDKWVYRDDAVTVSLDFSKLERHAPGLAIPAKLALIWYAENRSADHLLNMFGRAEHFLRSLHSESGKPVSVITSNEVINYRSILNGSNGWYLGTLSGFLQKWYELDIPGVTEDAVALLRQLRLKGNRKGVAILTMSPEDGPFTDIELQAIQSALNEAFSEGSIEIGDYLLAWLFMLLGQRPIQYAALKVADFKVSFARDDAATYTIRIPRVKQRNQNLRVEFKDRILIPQVGELLKKYVNSVKNDFASLLNDPNQAPIFPARRRGGKEPEGYSYHRTAASIALALEAVLNRLNVTSERTGKPINITATRFRRTIGTRAALEGHGELVIAELLDHSDTQNVGVYVEAVPGIIERIDRAMAIHLAPLAQAFAGEIIGDESDAVRAGDVSSRICDPQIDPSMRPMGNCGKHGFCGFLAPIACYTCRNFQPWLDGSHDAVLDHLIVERERLLAGGDARIATVNDRTILAVAEVVRRCKEIRDGIVEATNG